MKNPEQTSFEDWKISRFKQPWYTGDTISVGIGHGYWTVTALQLARATSILVKRGQDVVPKMLNTILDPTIKDLPETTALQDVVPRIRLQRDVDWQVSLDMYKVNHGKSGTARRAFRSTKYKQVVNPVRLRLLV